MTERVGGGNGKLSTKETALSTTCGNCGSSFIWHRKKYFSDSFIKSILSPLPKPNMHSIYIVIYLEQWAILGSVTFLLFFSNYWLQLAQMPEEKNYFH